MVYPYYTGQPGRRPDATPDLPTPALLGRARPEAYLPEPGLVDAANVALVLGQPLLLTGEPGTGKTQFAWSLATELGLGDPLVFETKSGSVARDLFYTMDTMRRFHAAHFGGSANPVDYITYNALGLAILDSAGRAAHRDLLTPELAADTARPRRALVLIDEIDKAPRDFPNDLLTEIEQLYFRIPELGNATVRADPALRPVVVITSNSEKHLPDAFLRRCVFYHLAFPDAERLKRIVLLRLASDRDGVQPMRLGEAFLADAIGFFELLRQPETGLRKKPGTAELLGWVVALADAGADLAAPLARQQGPMRACLGALVKDGGDQATAAGLVERWQGR